MKNIYNASHNIFKWFVFTIIVFGFFSGCEIQDNFEYQPSPTNPNLNMTAWEFIQDRSDIMSSMQEAVTRAQMENYYSDNKGYTYIMPRNNAWKKYLTANKYASVADIPVNVLQNVLKYHLVKAKVNFSDPALLEANNPIAYPTESGQVMYLSHSTNYQGLINQGTKKQWTIITSNLEATNGTVHVTDDVVYLNQ
ncbi:MAG: fasciclin domain-containing protein [Petrimonas sp.]|nr:fasciclin domain-containing protein [Petrimonas sp.]